MFKLFKSKKQEAKLKEAPIITSKKEVKKVLELSNLSIEYNADYRNMYRAKLTYKENINNWTNEGINENVEIIGEDWGDLIEKVTKHFEGEKSE